jgi:hypothetical protein
MPQTVASLAGYSWERHLQHSHQLRMSPPPSHVALAGTSWQLGRSSVQLTSASSSILQSVAVGASPGASARRMPQLFQIRNQPLKNPPHNISLIMASYRGAHTCNCLQCCSIKGRGSAWSQSLCGLNSLGQASLAMNKPVCQRQAMTQQSSDEIDTVYSCGLLQLTACTPSPAWLDQTQAAADSSTIH